MGAATHELDNEKILGMGWDVGLCAVVLWPVVDEKGDKALSVWELQDRPPSWRHGSRI